MKAAVVEAPGRLVVRDLPDPQPGPYQALCEILYGATCAATDRHIVEGTFFLPLTYPGVLGHESIGRVVAVGEQVRHYRVGDLVTRVGAPAYPELGIGTCWGGFAELGLALDHEALREAGLPPEAWAAGRVNQVLPADFDPARATLIITWRETYSYLTRLGVGPGARVLVIGSGANGLAFVNHARNRGAAQIVLVGSEARLPAARAVGATAAYGYRQEQVAAQVAAECPEGFDYMIDAVGKRGTLDPFLASLRTGGAVGIYGVDDFHTMTLMPLRVGGTFTFFNGGYDEAESHAAVVEFIRQGRLVADHYLDLARPFPLAEIGEAFAALARREMVKALIVCRGTPG